MRLKRRKRNETALWILGVAAGVLVTAGILAAISRGRRGRNALRREMRILEKRVIRALRSKPSTREQAVDVEALGAGVVELSGYVDTEELAREVVELVDRAQGQGLVTRAPDPDDARVVRVLLTGQGEQILARLSALHRDELRRMGTTLTLPNWHDEPEDSAGHGPGR